MPRVSVIVPVHNRADLVEATLRSALAAVGEGDEIVVCDDGSTDGTVEVCERIGGAVRVVSQKRAGTSAARNRAAGESTGEWLAFLDSDDAWTPDSLRRRLARAEAEPDADLVYSDARVTGPGVASGRLVSDRRAPHAGIVTDRLLGENFLCTSAVLLRREAFLRAGGFRAGFEPAEDYDLWLRVSVGSSFACEPAPLVDYRVHPGSAGADLRRMFDAEVRVIEDFAAAAGEARKRLIADRLARLYYFLGILELESEPHIARRHFWASVRQRPPSPKAMAFAAATLWPRCVAGSTRRFLDRIELF